MTQDPIAMIADLIDGKGEKRYGLSAVNQRAHALQQSPSALYGQNLWRRWCRCEEGCDICDAHSLDGQTELLEGHSSNFWLRSVC